MARLAARDLRTASNAYGPTQMEGRAFDESIRFANATAAEKISREELPGVERVEKVMRMRRAFAGRRAARPRLHRDDAAGQGAGDPRRWIKDRGVEVR